MVPVEPTPRVNAPHCSAKTIGGRLAFDNPLTFLRAAPEMGEAQKVKRPGTLMRLLVPTACRRGRWPEGNKLRLSGMNRQPVLAEPLRQNFHDALGIALIAKSNYESSSPGESHPQALTEPDVNLSAHPAPIVQSQVEFQSATSRTGWVPGGPPGPASEPPAVDDDRVV